MSVPGLKDARRCSYLGELDSEEESDEISDEFEFSHEITAIPGGHFANYSIATSPTIRARVANSSNASQGNGRQYESYLEHFERLPDRQKQGLVKKLLEALREDPKSEENLMDAVKMAKFRAFQVKQSQEGSKARPKYDIRTKRSNADEDMDAEDNGGEVIDEAEEDIFDLSDFPEDVIYDLVDQGEFNMESPNDRSREEVH